MPYITDVYPESAEDEFDPATDLLGVIDTKQPDNESFSLESDDATVIYEIPFHKKRSFLRYALGFAYLDRPRYTSEQAAPLRRENPIRHPYFPQMRAVSVSFQGFGISGRITSPPPPLSPPPPPPGRFDNGLSAEGPRDGRYAKYQTCTATVKFKTPIWSLLDDDDERVGYYGEIARNTFIDVASSVESLSAEGPVGQLQWAETSGGSPAGPSVGKAVTSAFNTLVSKNNFLLNLVQFPAEFFSAGQLSNEPFMPTNVLKCVGRVNNSPFLGFPAGTLLMQPPKFQRFRWPVLGATDRVAFMGYNVQIPFQHHDPEKGNPSSDYRGFRLLPWAANLLWYRATRKDASKHLLAEANFNDIFVTPVQGT